MGKRSTKSTKLLQSVKLLQAITAVTIKFDEIEKLVKVIRAEVEKNVWEEREDNPNCARPIEDLDLCAQARNHVPPSAKTIGELVEYSASELALTKTRYLFEIRDSLRSLGLVLKPED